MNTLILGAGPAGLAMAGRLTQAGQPYTLLEAADCVGSAWHRHYDRLHLHTVKEHSALPGLRYPDYYPRYVSKAQFIAYLERYVRHFGIQPRLGETATLVRPVVRHSVVRHSGQDRPSEGGWMVETAMGTTYQAGNVVVCTGYNRIPNVVALPGQAAFQGRILHSYDYRTGATFRGQRVLVVGFGNTGSEIALDLLEQGAQPTLSVRGPVNVVRREAFGRPSQPTAIALGKFPNWVYDAVAGLVQRLSVGNLEQYGLKKLPYPPSRQIREHRSIPMIDVGTLDEIKAGRIPVRPGIQSISEHGATFVDGRTGEFDAIILATGYRTGLTDLLAPDVAARVLDERGYPRAMWFRNATLPEQHRLDGLYFLGFTIPLAGVLRSIGLDSGAIAAHLLRFSSHR